MALKYRRTTAKERKAIARESMLDNYLVAHRNWGYETTIKGMAPQLVVYRRCVDMAPGPGTFVKASNGQRYYLHSEGNLIRA